MIQPGLVSPDTYTCDTLPSPHSLVRGPSAAKGLQQASVPSAGSRDVEDTGQRATARAFDALDRQGKCPVSAGRSHSSTATAADSRGSCSTDQSDLTSSYSIRTLAATFKSWCALPLPPALFISPMKCLANQVCARCPMVTAPTCCSMALLELARRPSSLLSYARYTGRVQRRYDHTSSFGTASCVL